MVDNQGILLCTYFAWPQYRSSGRSPRIRQSPLEARLAKPCRPLQRQHIISTKRRSPKSEIPTDDKVNLELLDTETNSNQCRRTPDETILYNGADRGLELLHVCLVVPWFDIHGHHRLGLPY